jgi:hypothetical protein
MKSKHVLHVHQSDLWRLTVRGTFTTLDDPSDSVVGFYLLTEYRNVRVRKECGVEGIRAFPRGVSGVSTNFRP